MQHWVRALFEELASANNKMTDKTRKDVKRTIEIIENSDAHYFRTHELEALANELSQSDGLNQLSELMWKITTSLGFQNFAIFVLQQGRNRTFEPRICTSCNAKWISRYVDQRYQYVDPVIARASEREGWFLFSDITTSSRSVESFWQDADKYKIGRNGVCFSMFREDGTRIGVSYTTQNSANYVEESVRTNFIDMFFLAQIASDTFCYAAIGEDLPDNTLTEEELRFLHVLATSANPEDALRILPCFGSNASLQSSIKSKIGVETVFQAIAIAASKGWFDLLPYGANEIVKSFSPLRGLEADYEKCVITDPSSEIMSLNEKSSESN